MIYFLSDAHLGSRAIEHPRTHERRVVNFLDAIKHKAEAVYLLGDMFDFWFEYKEVVPRGYTRFLGKLSELTDMGVEVHYFVGNHDQWMDDYLEKECGVILHHHPETIELHGKEFYLAHGHGLDYRDRNWKTRLLFSLFGSKVLRRLVKMIHPHFFMNFGLNWARHSRTKRRKGAEKDAFAHEDSLIGYKHAEEAGNGSIVSPSFASETPYLGEKKEGLVLFAKDYLKGHPGINYFIFGHRHIELDLRLAHGKQIVILGEWMTLFTFATFDGENLYLDNFIEGETNL